MPLVPAAFAVVSSHQPALGPRDGLWPVLLMCVIHKEGLCPSSGEINRLMMMIEPKTLFSLVKLATLERIIRVGTMF
jgi:hypothetical protein